MDARSYAASYTEGTSDRLETTYNSLNGRAFWVVDHNVNYRSYNSRMGPDLLRLSVVYDYVLNSIATN